MKKVLLLLFLSMFFVATHAQKRADVGVFYGRTYYLGDLNPKMHFSNHKMILGAIYRYNLNYRYAVRANLFLGTLEYSDDLSIFGYQIARGKNFHTNYYDFSGQFEFNFFPYKPGDKKMNNSPYVAAGITFFYLTSAKRGGPYQLGIPFGIGYKFNVTKRLSAGLEWSFRKTFTDMIDWISGHDDMPLVDGALNGPVRGLKQEGYLNDNDWYSFAGIFITYKFKEAGLGCPDAYKEYY